MKEFKHFINGKFVGSDSRKTFENRNPADNSLLGLIHEAREIEVAATLAPAKKAMQGPWAKFTQTARIDMLNRVADCINERFEEFLDAECKDTGKLRKIASHIDIPRGAASFKAFSETLANHPTESFTLDTHEWLFKQ